MNPFKSKKRTNPPIAYTTEPAAAWVFAPSPKYREVTAAKKPQYRLYTIPQKGLIRLTESKRLSGYLPGLTPIHAEARNAIVEIIGVAGSETFLEMEGRADAPDAKQARRLLDQVTMELKGGRLQLFNSPDGHNQHCLTEFTILCPKERRTTVRGSYSAVRLADLIAGADVETNHARITIQNVGPVVNARVEEGIIDYSGNEGSVRLFAGWELNLNFVSQEFAGNVDAEAEGPVRVLIPEGFATCFEASIAKDAPFVCRTDIKSQIMERTKAGRLTYTFGQGAPVIRLLSRKGPIVIDNTGDPLGEKQRD